MDSGLGWMDGWMGLGWVGLGWYELIDQSIGLFLACFCVRQMCLLEFVLSMCLCVFVSSVYVWRVAVGWLLGECCLCWGC